MLSKRDEEGGLRQRAEASLSAKLEISASDPPSTWWPGER
jgi:hypothetical protein